MTEVLFYHLETRPLERVLPVLLQRTLDREWRAVVEVGSSERLEVLDEVLWTFADDSFLPHAVARGGESDARQPVILTAGPDNPNNAQVRFFVGRAVPRSAEGYERIVFMFSGHDPEGVAEARAAWRALRESADLTYWQQDADGRWTKRA